MDGVAGIGVNATPGTLSTKDTDHTIIQNHMGSALDASGAAASPRTLFELLSSIAELPEVDPILSLVQSSGTGKSRAVREIARIKFLFVASTTDPISSAYPRQSRSIDALTTSTEEIAIEKFLARWSLTFLKFLRDTPEASPAVWYELQLTLKELEQLPPDSDARALMRKARIADLTANDQKILPVVIDEARS